MHMHAEQAHRFWDYQRVRVCGVACSQPNAISALQKIYPIPRKPERGEAAKYAKFLSVNSENIKT